MVSGSASLMTTSTTTTASWSKNNNAIPGAYPVWFNQKQNFSWEDAFSQKIASVFVMFSMQLHSGAYGLKTINNTFYERN